MGTATKTIAYRYDSVGNRSGLTDPDGGRFTYAYDSVRRITHLENPQNERTSYAYDAAGRRSPILIHVNAERFFDQLSEMTPFHIHSLAVRLQQFHINPK